MKLLSRMPPRGQCPNRLKNDFLSITRFMDTRTSKFAFLLPLLLALSVASAQTSEPTAEGAPEKTAEVHLLALVEEQEDNQRDIDMLEERIANTEGLRLEFLTARLDQANLELLDSVIRLAREVIDAQESEIDTSPYVESVATILRTLPSKAFAAADRVVERIDLAASPGAPGEAILADQQFAIDASEIDAIFTDLIDYLEVAPAFDIAIAEDRARIVALLMDSAENRSIFLDAANREVEKLRVATTTLPEDSDLQAWLKVREARAQIASQALGSVVALMNRLDINTDDFRRMLITSTGEISSLLDVSVLAGLFADWTNHIRETIRAEGPGMLFSLLLGILLFLLFIQLGKIVQKLVARGLKANRVSMSNLLKKKILSTVRNIFLMIGLLVALSQVGISLGPLLAGLGIAGFIIGFALQDSLSNFVSGLMILFYRPFDVGDFVEVAGVKGKINTMSLVNTSFLTFDNQKLIVPNNMVWQSVIINYTDQSTRRVDLEFGISYGDDIDEAERIIREVMEGFDTILEDPAPVIKVGTLGDSSVNLIVRPWVSTEDYWNTYWDLTKLVKQAFDREGITIPFPQRDVHHFGQPPATDSGD